MREVGREEFLVCWESPALPGGGSVLGGPPVKITGTRHPRKPDLLIGV